MVLASVQRRLRRLPGLTWDGVPPSGRATPVPTLFWEAGTSRDAERPIHLRSGS